MKSGYFKILQGDARKAIRELPQSSFRAVITSPPYYGHRTYGTDSSEIGREESPQRYLDSLVNVFRSCRDALTEDGSLWIVIGDTRRRGEKLRIPHLLAERLAKECGYTFREDIIWYKKNNISSSSRNDFSQAYEYILFFSKNRKSYTNLDAVRIQGNEAVEGRNKIPPRELIQYQALAQNKKEIERITRVIHQATPSTPISKLPSTSEIARAYGYEPEKYCPTCYRKLKRHATRRRIGNHSHYPIFAVCNPKGKNPSNVWEVATKAHYGNEHFAIFPEEIVHRIISFATKPGDSILDPFVGRGTTGIVAASLQRNFVGIDLYGRNVALAQRNIADASQKRGGSGNQNTRQVDTRTQQVDESTANPNLLMGLVVSKERQ